MALERDILDGIRELSAKDELFTDIDVVNKAAGNWDNTLYKKAHHLATNKLSQEYRRNKVVRYGPVEWKDPDTGEQKQDYARRASRIVYAGTNGPAKWKTPNGNFPKMSHDKDALPAQQGRRKGNDRDDSKPWPWAEEKRPKETLPPPSPSTVDAGELENRVKIRELETRVRSLREERDAERAKREALEHSMGEREPEPEAGLAISVTLPEHVLDQIVARVSERVETPTANPDEMAERAISRVAEQLMDVVTQPKEVAS